jgi:hypothetical protein
MTKLNSLARARLIGPEGDAEDGAAGDGVGEGAAGVDVLAVSSSRYVGAELAIVIFFCIISATRLPLASRVSNSFGSTEEVARNSSSAF